MADASLEALIEGVCEKAVARLMASMKAGEAPLAPEWLTTAQVAQVTGFKIKTLEMMRASGDGPRFRRVGRAIRYNIADVRAWIEKEDSTG